MHITGESALIGRWESPEVGAPCLVFAEHGTVTGSDGCNGIHSTYVATEEGAAIAPFVSTLKACIGVNTWLRGVRTVQLRGDTLIVDDVSGEKLGELQRVA